MSLTEGIRLPLFKFGRSSSSNYPYVVARIKGKKRLLLKKEQYQKLLNMTLSEIALFMEETMYKKEIDELSLTYRGVDLIEMSLYKNLANSHRQILSFSTGELKKIIALYISKWDVYNIKLILRAAAISIEPKDVINYVVAAGDMDLPLWSDAVKIRDFNTLIEYLLKTDYGGVIGKWKREKGTVDNLPILEDMLDRAYYESRVSMMNDSIEAGKIIKDLFRYEIDMVNLTTMLRLKSENIPYEQYKERFIKYGKDIKMDDIQRLYGMPVRDTLDYVIKIPFYESLKEEAEEYAKEGMLENFIRKLENHYDIAEGKISERYPLSPLPVLNYLHLKWIEINNIRIIARGIERGLSREDISTLLVGV
ncbi:MAG: ATP synthase A1 subunit C [Candidatus Thermoplasmatota archaeon]|jgi:V/A-type H+-transporting ATPase subunit C|nr:ATP synthase A1 subunit C [Candidatus Thermoplasmatota archaeon]